MTADEIIAKVKDLPVVSETARKLTIQLGQPDLHRDELVNTLRCDNILTAKLLRVCNSAEAGMREPVVSLDQALFLLGHDMIFRTVSAIGYGASLKPASPGCETEANGLWAHSLSTAVGAEYLAKTGSYGDYPPATAFTAGLLHDIGKTVICKVITPKDRAEIRNKMASSSVTRVEAERAVLGADHCEIGACLLKRWSLPEPIIEAVGNHHCPVTKPRIELSAVVYFANAAAHLSGAPEWEPDVLHAKSATAHALGIDIVKVDQTIASINGAMQMFTQLEAAA
jgi:putative nucleotidyltransferase with HDIG domain